MAAIEPPFLLAVTMIAREVEVRAANEMTVKLTTVSGETR
jgi:hypothetical protein